MTKKKNKYNNTTYIISDRSYNDLTKKGFKFSISEESYIYKFVIKKWNKYPVLFGKIRVNEYTGEISIDVMKENGELYAPFYSQQYGNYDSSIINTINRRIDKELKKLGIVKMQNKLLKENKDENCT